MSIEHPEDDNTLDAARARVDAAGGPNLADLRRRNPIWPGLGPASSAQRAEEWRQQAIEQGRTFVPPPLGLTWPRPPGGWSDSGPV